LIAIFTKWIERSKQRKALGRLNERMLADIALTPAQVAHEISKPFWK